ncbi:MAG: hypothetical protein KAS32_17090 [Candidatus Peribacteraceae bacterium]|nr:hypothetical protein [Candidatus Peribacteraceae bacterium]
MKRILILMMIMGTASAYPLLFGPAGMPAVWDDITTIDADSANVNHLVVNTTAELGESVTTDSAGTVSLNTNALNWGASTTGDQDGQIIFHESDDTWVLLLNDGIGVWDFDRAGNFTGNVGCTFINNSTNFSIGSEGQSAGNLLSDPNRSGPGTHFLGNNEADTTIIQASDFLKLDGDILTAGDAVTVGAWTRYLMISAGSATLGPTAPTWATHGTAGALAFDADAEVVHLTKEVPDDWDGVSDLSLDVYWTNEDGDNIADTETVIWLCSYRSIIWGTENIENGTAVSPSVTYTQSGAGADGDSHISDIVIDYDNGNQPVTAGDTIIMIFSRDMTNDTYGGDALVGQWEVEYTSVGLPNHN